MCEIEKGVDDWVVLSSAKKRINGQLGCTMNRFICYTRIVTSDSLVEAELVTWLAHARFVSLRNPWAARCFFPSRRFVDIDLYDFHIAAAAIRALSDLAAIDAELIATCARECVGAACALVEVGRDPVARELAELFAGPIADVVGRATTAEGAEGSDEADGAEDAPTTPMTPESNSDAREPMASGDDGAKLEPNAEEEERRADPA